MASFYGIDRSVLVDGAAEAERARKAEEKAKRDREKSGRKAKDTPSDETAPQEPAAERSEPQAAEATVEPTTGDGAEVS